MLCSACRLTVATSLVAIALPVQAANRPRYGGTLRVQMQAGVRTLDPTEPAAGDAELAAREKLAGLVFERLVRLDEKGRPQPGLAISWENAQAGNRWLFHLRPGVRFHDGSALTPAAAAAALAAAGNGWEISPSPDGIRIRFDGALPELLSALADLRRSIVLRAPDGALAGTGPFRVAEWQPGTRALLKANEEYWGGRPFLDAVSVEMSRSAHQQMLDLELGKADLVEMPPGEFRRGAQAPVQIWTTAPVGLLAVVFERNRAPIEDTRLREAVALSIDRAAIHTVLLQKQGEPTGALLPQWLSGHAFLFPAVRDIARARDLAAAVPPLAAPLSLGYDPSDQVARAIAERVAVNAREAGIRIQVSAQAARPDLRITRFRLRSAGPAPALAALASLLEVQNAPDLSSPEARYAAERVLIEDYRLIPLVHLPETYAVRTTVRTWLTRGVLKNSEWRIEDVWLGREQP